jgi:hypothetical protein
MAHLFYRSTGIRPESTDWTDEKEQKNDACRNSRSQQQETLPVLVELALRYHHIYGTELRAARFSW